MEHIRGPKINGVRRPGKKTKCGRMWTICDNITKRKGRYALRSEVLIQAGVEKFNLGTVAAQYQLWTRWNGISREDLAKIRFG